MGRGGPPKKKGPAAAKPAADLSVSEKALKAQGRFSKEDFPELLTILYWVRQVLGILIGVAFGIVPMQGIMGFGGFAALNAGIPMIYYGKFLEVDQDSYGGGWNLIKEGFMPSTGLFLVYTIQAT